ncbi:MerR family transcriptional regulator [Halalkalibacter oceani]|uniref:MerR family transcriptional regulator n=1 Tax=Halalkalibacter oceani TaxID=1653776 RepID=A0A9X2DTE4_9BACI|nr:MerR family transcriptional regulator [Halalkalibacter oceani]MCM3714958.1 MerR family transcriptional regulator [Halalkalibacter oceani]
MYQISEVARLVNLPIPTIRYYETLGFIETPAKDARGYKMYRKQDVEYLRFIVHLRDTDMPLEQIKHYVHAYRLDDYSTCYAILQEHEQKMQLELAKRQMILEKIQYKVSHFSKLKGGGT